VVILAGAITGNQPVISANGTTAATVEGDGGGGGGSGGTIYLQTNSAPQNLQLRANGGGGGNTSNNNSNRCFGPGGGGGGGRILADLPGIAIPAGGNAGIVTNSTNGCLGSTNGAEAGQNGRIDSILGIPKGALPLRPEITMEAQSDTVCAGKPAFFSIHTNAGNWNLQWQFNSGAAWQNIAAGMGFAGFQEDTLLINNVSESMDGWLFRVNIQRPGCFELNSQPAELRVAKLPMANFSVQMQADLAVFTNLSVGADAYLWSFGDGQFSEETDPQHAYPSEGMYTVALTVFNSCDTVVFTEDINVLLLPNAAFSAPDSAVACGPATVMFENLSSENSGSFQWFFPGGTPESTSEMNPEVVYDLSGVYFATLVVANNAGFDTATHLIYVQVLDFPNAHFTYSILPGGVVDFVNTSMPEAGFSWDFGDGSPAVSADSILTHQYLESGTYTISLVASNACGASVFQEMIQINLESVGLADMQSDTPIRVYPNPAGQYLIVDCMRINRAPDNIRLLDVSGRPVLEKYGMTGLTTVVSLEEIPAGAYLLEVRAGTSVKRQIVIRSEK
jgi:PKD repeat protein